jgi:peroxiredoxin
VVVRGTYDTAGLRADADLMIWAHAPSAEALQELYSSFRKTLLGQCCEPAWAGMALHRPAEFNKSHIPAYLAGEAARDWACVYPFVRSYEWYLLPDAERRALLAEHGKMSRDYPDVRANTVPSFALGDYEWLLCFEADELHRIVDLMRHLRGSETRRHVRDRGAVLHRPPQAARPIRPLVRAVFCRRRPGAPRPLTLPRSAPIKMPPSTDSRTTSPALRS